MKMGRKQIVVEVQFYKDREFSRKTVPHLSDCVYCPHFVVKGTDEYLGVSFIAGDVAESDITANAVVETIYDNVDYGSLLAANAEFYIVEGGSIVGAGKVLELI